MSSPNLGSVYMRFMSYINQITYFMDDCKDSKKVRELKAILTHFRYESRYEREIREPQFVRMAHEADQLMRA